jgi:hypothetical protein
MPVCETCGDDCDEAFRPPACDVRIIGHRFEQDGMVFCCGPCAGAVGAKGLRDRP